MPIIPPPSGQAALLTKLFNACNRLSYYSRSATEVWEAIDTAGLRVYMAVLQQLKTYFIVIDESSLTLVSGTQEYALPAGAKQIVTMAERTGPTQDWRRMWPEDLGDVLSNQLQSQGLYSFSFTEDSEFTWYGPYLDESDTPTDVQIYKIRFSPAIQDTRNVQLVYTASWVTITGTASPFTLPSEAYNAVRDFAVSELLAANGDQLGISYATNGETKKRELLTWIRDLQIQEEPFVKAYLL